MQGLAVAKTIEALYMSQTKLGPFLPEVLYTLRRLEFLAIKNNTIIGGYRVPAQSCTKCVTEDLLSCFDLMVCHQVTRFVTMRVYHHRDPGRFSKTRALGYSVGR